MTEANWRKVQGLEDFAKRHGRSLLELAFSWLAAKPVERDRGSDEAGAAGAERQSGRVAADAGGPRRNRPPACLKGYNLLMLRCSRGARASKHAPSAGRCIGGVASFEARLRLAPQDEGLGRMARRS